MNGEPVPALAKALVKFQAELPKVGKDKTAKMGTYSYNYADLATLTHIVMPLLVKHGLSFVCAPRATDAGYELVGVLLHESGERLEGALPIYGRQPQEIGSALSYARRYLLSAMTGTVTEDDDDGQAAVKATRTGVKDWGAVVDTAASLTDVDALRQLWVTEGVGKAPRAVQEAVKARVQAAEAWTATPEDEAAIVEAKATKA